MVSNFALQARTHIAKGEFLRAARVAKDAQMILAQLAVGHPDGGSVIEQLRFHGGKPFPPRKIKKGMDSYLVDR